MKPLAPTGLVLFTYRVGFGDCFLLRVEYRDRPRHLLIDFGSAAAPPHVAPEGELPQIAKDIAKKCGGRLEAIVASHRHVDHVSGFTGQSWKTIAKLEPKLVSLPWTEHPQALVEGGDAQARALLGPVERHYAHALEQMHRVAQHAVDEAKRRGPREASDDELDDEPVGVEKPFGPLLSRQLSFLGEDNLKPTEALQNLLGLPRREFLAFGRKSQLGSLFPGLRVHVLGPPTMAQRAEASRTRADEVDEFWHLAGQASARTVALRAGKQLFARVEPVPPRALPIDARWFLKRLDTMRGDQLLQLVRLVDQEISNTSLILGLEACGQTLLFPGDAQLQSWAFALQHPKVQKLLEKTSAYKVGHHGSLGATPKSLWKTFTKRSSKQGGLKTFLSTRPDKHGTRANETEVPRRVLMAELQRESEAFSTLELTTPGHFVHETRLA